jgi:hydrogenase maturation protease
LTEAKTGVLVLGAGNILLQDEGTGVRALARLLARYALPAEIQAIDGGTMGLDLLPYLDGISDLLIVDAVRAGRAPGSLVRLEGDEIRAGLALKLSIHQVGLQELLATCRLRGDAPARVVLWGIEPASIDWGLALSPTVAAALDDLVASVADELRAWGVAVADGLH